MSDKSKVPFWYESNIPISSPSSSSKESCSDCKANKTLELILEKLELQNSLIKQHFSVSNKDLQKEKNSEELKNGVIIQQMQEKIQSLTEKVNDQQIMFKQNLNFQQMQLKFNDEKKEKDNEINRQLLPPHAKSEMADADNNNTAASSETNQPPTEFIRIKVVDQNYNELSFRFKFGTEMLRLKKAFAKRNNIWMMSLPSFYFLFNGIRVNDYDTPKSLGMKEDDIIEVNQENW
ncbi:hypothetical protein ACQ4LE_006784 [Meloidogyne hapla]|uniref:Ubiquitin-like domain-containing protein n=1 Tax=Meloidogyne hapla TaxID=6305 RepID=A0A1I8B7T1_MELHA